MTFAPRLEEVTPGNFETATAIRVHPDQEFAASPVMQSLAEAYVLPHSRLRSSGGTPTRAWPGPV